MSLAKFAAQELELAVFKQSLFLCEPPRWRQLLLIEPDIQREKNFSPQKHCLNLLDGTLDLTTLELHDHDPRDEFLTFLNLGYDEICNPVSGEAFERFIDNASNGDGKIRTQVLELIAIAISGYEVKHFYALLGTCLDLPNEPLPAIAVGIIKQLVGDAPIKVEAKYKDSRTIYRKPLMLFCGNHPIRIPEIKKEDAFLNRQVIIPFYNSVPDAEQKRALYELLLEESPYIVAHTIQAYRDLMARNFVVTRTEVPPEYALEDSRQNFLAVQDFVGRHCIMDKDGEASTESLYQAFISDETYPQLTKVDFSRMLSEVLGQSAHPIKRAGASNSRGYRGIRLCQDLQ